MVKFSPKSVSGSILDKSTFSCWKVQNLPIGTKYCGLKPNMVQNFFFENRSKKFILDQNGPKITFWIKLVWAFFDQILLYHAFSKTNREFYDVKNLLNIMIYKHPRIKLLAYQFILTLLTYKQNISQTIFFLKN